MYKHSIKIFYRPEMVSEQSVSITSKSPLKPKFLMEYLKNNNLLENNFDIVHDFKPFDKLDFYLTHDTEYVNDFFDGKEPLASSNVMQWNPQFADSVRYTNSSLYNAIKYACENPDSVTFSPTSGFHHASPERGWGYCTFSGQVIASLKLYKEKGLRGAYIDLDCHFGNSIGDSEDFCLEKHGVKLSETAIKMNINPSGTHLSYLEDLRQKMQKLGDKVISGKIDYAVFCHGADSHESDDLGGHVNTEEWIEASTIVYNEIKKISETIKRPLPLTLALFGGYRHNNFEAVLKLHCADLVKGLNILCGKSIKYTIDVR